MLTSQVIHPGARFYQDILDFYFVCFFWRSFFGVGLVSFKVSGEKLKDWTLWFERLWDGF